MLIKTGELGANVEVMSVLVLIKVVDVGFVDDEKLVTELLEALMLVLIKVVDLVVVEEEEVLTVLGLGVLNKTGELVAANVEVKGMVFSVLHSDFVVVRVDVLVIINVVSILGPNDIVVTSFVSVGKIVNIGDE